MFLMILRAEIERLEAVKTELQRQIAEEVKPWFFSILPCLCTRINCPFSFPLAGKSKCKAAVLCGNTKGSIARASSGS